MGVSVSIVNQTEDKCRGQSEYIHDSKLEHEQFTIDLRHTTSARKGYVHVIRMDSIPLNPELKTDPGSSALFHHQE
jgi:hypothetical protein